MSDEIKSHSKVAVLYGEVLLRGKYHLSLAKLYLNLLNLRELK